VSAPRKPARGSDLPQAKLTEALARTIRENRHGKTRKQRAAEFGVHQTTVKRIDLFLTWRNA